MGLRATLPNHIPACRSEFHLRFSETEYFLSSVSVPNLHIQLVGLLEAKGRFAVLRTGELKIRNRQICKVESKRTISIIETGVQLKIKDNGGKINENKNKVIRYFTC